MKKLGVLGKSFIKFLNFNGFKSLKLYSYVKFTIFISFSYYHFIDLSAIEYPCSYCNIISFIFVVLLLSAYWFIAYLNS